MDYSIDKEPYYVTHYYGDTLEDKKDLFKGNLIKCIRFIKNICEGLKACHNNEPDKIIHRDIKPENILITFNDDPVIIDFGLCFVENGERITFSEEQVGSRFFIPPECENGRSDLIGPKTDIYCIGKVFYYMITGGKIFARERQYDEKYKLTKNINTRIEYVYRILDGCVVEDISKRLSIDDLINELDKIENLVEDRYYPIETGNDKCRFCGEGIYILCGKMANWHISRKDNTPIVSGNVSEKLPIEFWRCPKCGNVQFFANWEVENFK